MKQKTGRTSPVVKLFKRKAQKKTETFKFETSLKLKGLPLEEYAHVSYAFQAAILRFERMLKESLLEGYITSSTLEKISREFELEDIRNMEIPPTPSLKVTFGADTPSILAKKPLPKTEPIPTKVPEEIPVPEPITPEAPSITPPAIKPEVTPEIEPTLPKIQAEPSTPTPKISFSFPETPTEPKTTLPSPTPSPLKETITPPTIPKISFPSIAKPTATPPTNLLAQSRGKREEDRATGIAILRKQMLTELKKIRSVVSEEER